MLGIADYLWRLIPANPILLRVVATAGKRRRDLFIRSGYLGLLICLVIFLVPWGGTGGLAELAKASAVLFQRMSYLQLGLVALLAPIFTAGAITQEKDSQTYDILLTTPLTNGQIVLGSLLSRLFFVIALLVSGIPIFAITQIFGGVAISSIVNSFFIAAATAFVTGALAMAIAVLKVGTRRTIFGFYLFVVLYLVGLALLDQLPFFQIIGHQTNANTPSHISWVTGLQPFLALRASLHDPSYTPPLLGDLPEGLHSWPISWYLTDPASFYTTFMLALSFVLVMPSIVVLRSMAQATISPVTWVVNKIRRSTGDKTRKPRTVWNNPVAWREAKTKGSAVRATFLLYGFIGAGLIGALVMVWLYASTAAPAVPDYVDAASYNAPNNYFTVYAKDGTPTTLSLNPPPTFTINGHDASPADVHDRYSVVGTPKVDAAGQQIGWVSLVLTDIPRRLSPSQAREFLLGATVVELAVILLIVTNVAASTVTREKEDGTLDLLLTSPITSRFYIWGKLRGLVSFALPLIAVPVLSVACFVAYDSFHFLASGSQAGQWIAFPEALLIMPGTLIIVCAFAAIVGMQMSLRCRKTVVAVMASVAIVVGLCAVLGFCGFQMLQSSGAEYVGSVAGSFSPFTMLSMEINPYEWSSISPGDDTPRLLMFIFSWIAVAVYAAVVAAMYKSMVKNFDMTIRKQSR
jgi:ABC-type transport system involved in multi-copper enzyme maturation permease subunit